MAKKSIDDNDELENEFEDFQDARSSALRRGAAAITSIPLILGSMLGEQHSLDRSHSSHDFSSYMSMLMKDVVIAKFRRAR